MAWYDPIVNPIKNAFNTLLKPITDFIKNMEKFITDMKKFVDCVFAFISYVVALSVYSSNVVIWSFTYFLPWLGQYFECIFQKIISLPKCFIWYWLQCVGWVMYLPFRIMFWCFGMEQFVNTYFWSSLEKIDKYIYDGLYTKIHIIHFPDSVMKKCYYCNIKPIGKKLPCACDLKKKYKAMIYCRSKEPTDTKKCKNAIVNKNFDCSKNEESPKV
jgi:hypothetical protein